MYCDGALPDGINRGTIVGGPRDGEWDGVVTTEELEATWGLEATEGRAHAAMSMDVFTSAVQPFRGKCSQSVT